MISSIALLIATTPTLALPPFGGEGPIAINCSMRDITTEVTTGVSTVNQLSVLTDFQKASGTVLETFDPGKILNFVNFSSAVMTLNPKTRDSYIFVFSTGKKALADAILLVRPDRDEVTGSLKPEYVGILAVKGPKNKTHLGFCELLGGRKATELFRSIDAWRAKGK